MKLPLSSLLARWRAQSPALREILLFAACLLVGLLLLPLLIWLFGRMTLGSYANGGPLKLWLDFLGGLAHGELPFWAVLAGPYLASLFFRGAALAWRRGALM